MGGWNSGCIKGGNLRGWVGGCGGVRPAAGVIGETLGFHWVFIGESME
jgi:hypothetical protein